MNVWLEAYECPNRQSENAQKNWILEINISGLLIWNNEMERNWNFILSAETNIPTVNCP